MRREIEYLIDSLIQAAQSHAQNARTANATIAEIYQCVSGSTGEVGNWHGAQPVRDAMDRQAKEIAFHVSRVDALRRFLSEKIAECQTRAKEIAQLKINHTDINVEFDRLNGVITRQMEDIERLTELAKSYHDLAENQKNDSENQAKEIARLREDLENIVEGEGLWTKSDMAHEAMRALKEEHP